jgi:HlyD family secretion protein
MIINSRNLFSHPYILTAFGLVVVIALFSGVYYAVESGTPAAPLESAQKASVSVIATGTVEPAQNPDLAFQSGGRVARIMVAVGDHVEKGQLLASLDTASLVAQRAQAAATLAAQEATLDKMRSGPRAVDVSAKQTAVAQAKLTLDNAYQTALNSISDAYGKSYAAVHSSTDTLFNNPNSFSPKLIFTTTDSSNVTAVESARSVVGNSFGTWQRSVMMLSSDTAATDIDTALSDSLTNLITLRAYANATIVALGSAVPTSAFSQTNVASYLTTVGALRDTISTLITTLQSTKQALAADTLAVQSAQNALDQVLAGSTPQDIAAQEAMVDAARASVANYNAQISNMQVAAPFAGAVASIHIKLGDIVPPNTVGISLNPNGALQVTAYVSEGDVARITIGQNADVTLDAYGTGRHFAAVISSIDRSPTMRQNIPAYKITLQFTTNDPAISSGMTANITLTQ